MPQVIEHLQTGIHCRFTNIATPEDVAVAIGKVNMALDAGDLHYVIYDFGQVNRVNAGIAAHLTFALNQRRSAGISQLNKLAVVTLDEVFSYLINEYKRYSSHLTQVFRCLADAQAWIAQQEIVIERQVHLSQDREVPALLAFDYRI